MGEIVDFESPVLRIAHDEADAGGVATLWLDRAEARNAMGVDLWRDLPRAMAVLSADTTVRAVVVAAEGPHFSVGLDLKAMGSMLTGGGGGGGRGDAGGSSMAARARSGRTEVLRLQDAITAVARCPKPVIAAVHGYCIGGGVDLIAACDIRLASADAVFSVREAKMAIVADLGSLQRLPAIINAGHLAELAYTGKDISAERAKEIGLVNDLAADAEGVHKAAHTLALEIASNSPIAVQGTKAVLARQRGPDRGRGPGLRGDLERRDAGLGRSHRGGDGLHGEAPAEVHRSLRRHRYGAGAQRLRRHQRLAERSRRASSARTDSSTSGATSFTMSSAESSNSATSSPPAPGSSSMAGSTRLPCTQPTSAIRRWYEGQFSGQRQGASGARSSTQKRAASPDA